jgi:hypothetical protein
MASKNKPSKPKAKPQPAYLGGKVAYETTRKKVLGKNGKPKKDKNGNFIYERVPVRDKQAGFLGARPALTENISPSTLAAQGSAAGAKSLGDLTKAYTPLFNTLARQQRGEIDTLAGQLDNQYTQDARQSLGASLASAGTMEQMAADELALGRSMSPEQMRQATQSARQAFSARGLGTGLGAASAELLNRDAFASQRERERRTFASGLLDSSGAMRQRGAGMLAELDPYSRAINPGLALGQSAQQYGLNTAGNQFGGAMDLFGGASTFNVNRMDNLRTNWMDNAAAIRGANKQADATRYAANAAKPTVFETVFEGFKGLSDQRLKTDIKPLGQTGDLLGLTAYEFRYKGDKKKRKGFMAQDVQKVLPEAVEEVDYQGTKRLAIKPMVIGAALAEEIMANAKAA